MDAEFYPAITAIKSGNIDRLRELLDQDPSLATACSSRSHPTLLQCLALEALDVPNKVEMAQMLIAGGADVNGALGAAACIDNVEITALLLDRGAAINGTGSWSPLEEALYWNNRRVIDLLLEYGPSVHNLRLAAGLGRTHFIESLFESDGKLKPEAGKIDWPFGELEKSNLNCTIKDELRAKVLFNLSKADRLLIRNSVSKATIPKGTTSHVMDGHSLGLGAHGFSVLSTLSACLTE